MRILITGADSFIGTNFRRFSKYKNIEETSIQNRELKNIDFQNFDVVLHLSAIVNPSRRIPDSEYSRVNSDLCLNVAEQAKKSGIKQFIFLSTVKVYGRFKSDSLTLNEKSPCYPDDPYGKSKFEAEIGLKELETPDFIVSIIRTPVVYGPGVKANMLKLIRIIEKFKILPFGGIKNKRHFTYVENLVGYIDRIIEITVPGTFLAMDNENISTTRLVEALSEYLNRKNLLFRLPVVVVKIMNALLPRYVESFYNSFSLDNSFTREILKYNPPYSIEEGLKRTIDSYLSKKRFHE